MQETWVGSLGQEDPLEEEMATHSSILAWEIPRTEETGGATVHGVTKSQAPLSNWKVKIKVVQSCPTLCDPVDYTVRGILQARILEWVAFFSRGSSQPSDQTLVFHIADGFLTSWATGKPKNIGVGSLSLLQQTFPTRESNWGLLHCRWILYQLSYQGLSSQERSD